ncbi:MULTISPECIES: quinone-dependent dihydroorotate dehydrogenase [unclassified Picosynechococcus]|uniref:quinone-dependent dihydroorotate dehydrogenase n=1 Tax=unclassified Picosynechococcus TaxID=3079910 RepID=UPI0007458F46|nr:MULTISPECIES: quinone-dependent dihydroorotate dehydrogenase [unclassified Picosynechococcus]AMA09800.1 dihydroorotate dehydrogenase [Picosynechococcus sp. PCC 73109]ANV91145.1 dihydroorotate dehydrogenase (quinone) [Picosynechococcus sp. PCC 8807]
MAFLNFAKPGYPLVLAAFKDNPEQGHRQLINALHWLERSPDLLWSRLAKEQMVAEFCVQDPRLSQTLWGLDFPNPVGLSAGCDKDAMAAGMWSRFGFGFAEMGAVTLHAQPGNPLPRLFRLPADQAALNRLGANNLGAAVMAKTLGESWQIEPRTIPIGINLCKSKVTPLEAAAQDYLGSFEALQAVADYFVVNVSSPNTPGLRSLQGGEQIQPILEALQQANTKQQPIFIKISPDLDWEAIANIVKIAQDYQLAGIIATNTTTRRDGLKTQILEKTGNPVTEEAGGISGAPVRQRSTEVIRFIYEQTQGSLPIIGVGGIFTADHAWEKITAGASLLQLYTGWIYKGPWIIPNILRGLLEKLETHNLNHISEAIGMANKHN